jgi:hypothetical protein
MPHEHPAVQKSQLPAARKGGIHLNFLTQKIKYKGVQLFMYTFYM